MVGSSDPRNSSDRTSALLPGPVRERLQWTAGCHVEILAIDLMTIIAPPVARAMLSSAAL